MSEGTQNGKGAITAFKVVKVMPCTCSDLYAILLVMIAMEHIQIEVSLH